MQRRYRSLILFWLPLLLVLSLGCLYKYNGFKFLSLDVELITNFMKKTLLLLFSAAGFIYCNAQQIDSTALNNVFGKKGAVTGNVYKVSFPRSDLKVKVGDFNVATGLALGTWVGIINMGEPCNDDG